MYQNQLISEINTERLERLRLGKEERQASREEEGTACYAWGKQPGWKEVNADWQQSFGKLEFHVNLNDSDKSSCF